VTSNSQGLRSVVLGVGSYLPERLVTNQDMEKMVETTDEWIVQRTGIRQRHLAADGETTSMLGAKAAERAMQAAGVGPVEIARRLGVSRMTVWRKLKADA